MTIDVTLANVGNLIDTTTAQTTINTNSGVIVTAFGSALNTSGDQMEGNLDMNSNRILNLPEPSTTFEPARLADIEVLTGGGTITVNPLPTGGTTGQILAKNSSSNYDAGWYNPTPVIASGSALPSGRITLTSGVAVPTTSVAAANVVYYTPYAGDVVPINTGTTIISDSFSQLSQSTTDATKSPAAVAVNSVYDLFVWLDGSTIRCTRGPAWSSSTTRGTAAALTFSQGLYFNNVSVTNGPGAGLGTYVGTIASNSSSTIDYVFGGVGAGGVAASFGVWNAYNRVSVSTMIADTTSSWTYAIANTWRAPNNNATMRASFVRGLNEDSVQAIYYALGTAGSATLICSGIGLDSTTTQTGTTGISGNTLGQTLSGAYSGTPGIGFHYLTALEALDTSTSSAFYGNAGFSVIQSGMHVTLVA